MSPKWVQAEPIKAQTRQEFVESCPIDLWGLGALGRLDLRKEPFGFTGIWQPPWFSPLLPPDPGCLHLSLATVPLLSSACLSRWFEALWLLPESQMDSFCEGQGQGRTEKKISLC